MKKLLSLFLSLAMLCALAAPALAYDSAEDLDPPLWKQCGYESYEEMMGTGYWTQEEYAGWVADEKASQAWKEAYIAAHADEIAAFDADAYFAREYADYGSAAEYMENWELTREDFEARMLDEYLDDLQFNEVVQEKWAALCAEQPERTARFLDEVETWFLAEYPYFESFAQYCAYFDSLPQVYLELFEEWNGAYEYALEQQAAREAYLTERGGIVGQVNVMVDGQCLSFPGDRLPYVQGGTLFADAAALSAALGIEIPAPLSGYAAVRSAAAKAGYEIYWDSDFHTAVLIDPAALVAAIDEEFTILNGALAALRNDPEKNYRSTVKLGLDLTMFDSLDGDKNLSMTLDGKTLQSAAGIEASGRYNFKKLTDYLTEALSGIYEPDEEKLELLSAMAKGEFAYRQDTENGMRYLRAPLLTALAELSGRDFPQNGWLSISGGSGTDSTAAALSVGALIYRTGLSNYNTPVYYYDDLVRQGAAAAGVLGDGQFTKKGANQVLELDLEDYAALSGAGEYGYLPREFAFNLTVKPNGTLAGSCTYRGPDYGYSSSSDSHISTDFSLSAASQTLTMEVHLKNQFKLVVTAKGSTSVTTAQPGVTPPEGDTVISSEDF